MDWRALLVFVQVEPRSASQLDRVSESRRRVRRQRKILVRLCVPHRINLIIASSWIRVSETGRRVDVRISFPFYLFCLGAALTDEVATNQTLESVRILCAEQAHQSMSPCRGTGRIYKSRFRSRSASPS